MILKMLMLLNMVTLDHLQSDLLWLVMDGRSGQTWQPGGRLDRVADAIGVTDRAWTNQDNLRAFDWELKIYFLR